MTDKEKLAEQYNAFCEELGLIKPIEILNACEVLDKVYKQGKHDATRWHYPSKGELPKEDANYFVTLERFSNKERIITTTWYSQEDGWGGFEALFYRVIAWQYIEPPQEEV